MSKAPYFAEIIESSLHTWRAQSWQWDHFPYFGSLVTIETKKRRLFGIVYQLTTGSTDPSRYPFTYQKTEEELLREQPQIFEFLHTTFSCLTIGYQEKSAIFYQLAPEPPKIHAFVKPADRHDAQLFFADLRYLHLLFSLSSSVLNLDELLLALLKHLSELHILTPAYATNFITSFSFLTGNDYRRLKIFLQRAQVFVEKSS